MFYFYSQKKMSIVTMAGVEVSDKDIEDCH